VRDATQVVHTHRSTGTTLEGILAVNPGTLMRTSQHTTFATLEINSQCITAELHDIR